MITPTGYSKDKNLQADVIAITWSVEMIKEKGSLLSFMRHFEKSMQTEDGLWLQKCKNPPKQDIIYVYIIVANRVLYRCFYGGFSTGRTMINNGDGHSFSHSTYVSWPRIHLAGPFTKAPHKIKLKGFQGFRYTTKLF